LVTPQILTYVNGGYTPTRFDNVNFPASRISLPGQTFNGGFIGGGTEVAVAALPGLYWRNEYRLSSYRATDVQFFAAGAPIAFFDHQTANVQTITTSLVYKFH
jgi:outer membrane immunogenic protein